MRGLTFRWACFGIVSSVLSATSFGATKILKTSYHGWDQAFVIGNETVEAVVVPAVGRVMQFRFRGDEDGPFWENRDLDGKSPNSQSAEWINFGGDKTWPAQQSDWAKITGRAWPPPKAFDSMPIDAEVQGETLVLKTKIDPSYGIRAERRITLFGSEPEMRIETIYRKVEGPPIRVAIWVVTQLGDPEKVFVAAPAKSMFPDGYNKQSDVLPENLHVTESLLSCTRSKTASTKIGSDASELFWGDARWVVQIRASREAAGNFPDNGSSAEVYTNPDPKKYIELETLGPLGQLKRGETMSRKQSYRLDRRTDRPLEEQVKSLINH